MRCDGQCLIPHKDDIIDVLKATLHLKCKEGADLAGNLLRHTLKALTLLYTMDYRSSAEGWDKPMGEHLPIRVFNFDFLQLIILETLERFLINLQRNFLQYSRTGVNRETLKIWN